MSASANGRMQCPEDSGSSDSECSSDAYQDVPLRLVTRHDDDDDPVLDDSTSPPAADARRNLCSQLRTHASHSPLHQNSQVDQDTNNLFGGDHNSVIRKGIANGKWQASASQSNDLWQALSPGTVIIRKWSSQA